MQNGFWNIYITFFKIGIMLLGGGYVILPLLQSEIAQKKSWILSEELVEYYAISQSLPGIIAANVSIFVGYKLKGFIGALCALAGIVTPAFLAIVLIANILLVLSGMSNVQNIFAGVGVGVAVLVILTVKEMWTKCIVDKFSLLIFVVAFILSILKFSPVVIVICGTLFGILTKYILEKLKQEGNK